MSDLISRKFVVTSLRDWQDDLNRHRLHDTALTVGIAADLIGAIPAIEAHPDPRVEVQCCLCGKTGLSTVEGDGGAECQLHDGRWTCSRVCYDRAVGPETWDTDRRDGVIERLVQAAIEVEEVMSLAERPEMPDPRHHETVKALGRKIGFGVIMSTASAAWSESNAADGYPTGGEFVSGPCRSTILAALKQLRAAIAAAKAVVK